MKNNNTQSYQPSLLRILVSKRFGGVGLFTTRSIKRGDIIAKWQDLNENKFFSWDVFNKFDSVTKNMMLHFCAQTEKGIYAADNINLISLPWHMNHCCNGNVGFNMEGDFISIKRIKAGEELCYDYGFVMSDPKYKLKCNCKDMKCRKIITGNDWKDLKYQKKYFKFMSPEIREML